MNNKENFYITTPIYYVNDIPHLGHAYTSIACDTIARFKRLDNYNVFFLTGTDEHGQKVEKSAAAAGKTPVEFTNKVSQRFEALSVALNLSNDDFIRTSEKRHKKSVQYLWNKLLDSGDIYLAKYSGWYSLRDEAFYSEKELQQDKKGNNIGPSGDILEWLEEPSYFFKLSKWEKKLLELYKNNPTFIQPSSRLNEIKKFVENGLEDLSISRTSFSWGIKVPNDEAHIIYVWLDALTNYLSALDWPNDNSLLSKFWPANFHVVGKDIIRFHSVYWPAFLMAAGVDIPKKIFAHGWWTIENKKMSKSIGNVIEPIALTKKYGVDQVRYFLLREVPFGQDGDFSHKALINRINSDLANDYGNLVQRVLSMVQKYYNGIVPESKKFISTDDEIINSTKNILDELRLNMDALNFSIALERIWKVIKICNSYIDKQEPWSLYKNDIPRLGTVLYILLETIRKIAILTQPFLPVVSKKVFNQLSLSEVITFDKIDVSIKAGLSLCKPNAIFPRIDNTK